MLITAQFFEAVTDFQYLMEKAYSMKNIVKMVGDRYKLNTIQRSFLYRGITTNENAKRRKQKLITERQVKAKILHIDAYNLLITIHSYLKGKPVFIAYDGYLRDAGELKSKISLNKSFNRAAEIAFSYLITTKFIEFIWYIDSPVKGSNDLEQLLKGIIDQTKVPGKLMLVQKADNILINLKNGVIASSDTEIIDGTELQLFDLAKNALYHHFNAHFLNLQNILNTKIYTDAKHTRIFKRY